MEAREAFGELKNEAAGQLTENTESRADVEGTRPRLGRGKNPSGGLRPELSDKCWVPFDKEIQIQGYVIPGGLYVGKDLRAIARRGQVEPALVNPLLPINVSCPDHRGKGVPHWPSYSTIPRRSRAAYLHWLANGRSDPGASIGYVFLYFYGLERRAASDTQHSLAATAELDVIFDEVQRLLNVYGENRSFQLFACRLLDLIATVSSERPLSEKLCPTAPLPDGNMSLQLRVGLGQLAAADMPLPCKWALAWLRCDALFSLRTSATRCADEFEALFALRYRRYYGTGVTIKTAAR